MIKTDLEELKKEFPEGRRTRVISGAAKTISQEDTVPEEEAVIVITQDGYVKRVNPTEYRTQKRGGKGIIGATTKEEDIIAQFVSVNTHDDLLFFTSLGKVYQTKAYEIPEGKRVAKGKSIVNFLMLSPEEQVTSMLAFPKKGAPANQALAMITRAGSIKKTAAQFFAAVRHSGIIAIKLQKGDALGWVRLVETGDELILATQRGAAIRFKEKDVRLMGRASAGVRAMRLKKNDRIVGADVIKKGAAGLELLAVSQHGFGKKTALKEYKIQRRGGSGIKTMNVTAKTGALVATRAIHAEESDLIAISKKGQVIRTPLKDISTLGRATQGVRIMKLDPGDEVASITTL